MMRQSLFITAVLFTFITPIYADNIHLNESYSVEIPHIKVALDNGKYDVAANVTWVFKDNAKKEDYIDSNLVVNDLKRFLTHYPNKTDFWEVINHQLSSSLINKYPQFQSISVKLNVPASMYDPYPHYSLITASRN